MKSQKPDHGFANIYYQGRPVQPDLTSRSDYFVVARNWLHRWWLTKIRHCPADKVIYLRDFKGTYDFNVDIQESVPAHGRVTRVKSAPEYSPNPKKDGGRVVRAMPRQLKKIKEGQEATDD